jgi:glycosyltransferase involved in cell wall biosynthesis
MRVLRLCSVYEAPPEALIRGDASDTVGGMQIHTARLTVGLGRVRSVGAVPHAEVQGYLQHAALVVLPSRYEERGRVALEAMAAGTPVVASRTGGIRQACGKARTASSSRRGTPMLWPRRSNACCTTANSPPRWPRRA